MPETKFSGHCQCGNVSYEIDAEPMMVVKCHCLECQRSAGTGHVVAIAFPEPAVKASGETSKHNYTADSGNIVTQKFCPSCGATVFAGSSGYPGMTTVRAGSLDSAMDIAPQMQVYTSRKQSWDALLPDVPSFPEMPPMEQATEG
ncbi:MAG: GFA family protein [Methyloligellaceae bacterium]